MASNYPGSLDSLTNPTAADTLNSATVPHADQHANANDAIEAIEATLGINPQGGSATVVARLNALDGTVSGKVASVGTGSTAITIGGTATAPTVAVASGSTSTAGVVQLTDSTSSTSTTTAATPNSVKSAYDLANTANTSAGTVSTNLTTHTSATTAHGSTSLNTASAIVQRDASGNFSAGTITATLSGNASTATSATTAGNLSGTQTANFVYAAPNGSSGTGSFRALVSADIPASLANTTSVNGTSIPASGTLLTSANNYLIGSAVVRADRTKAVNDTSNENVFFSNAGSSIALAVNANTVYLIEGTIILSKPATSLGRTVRIGGYYVDSSNANLTPQSWSMYSNTWDNSGQQWTLDQTTTITTGIGGLAQTLASTVSFQFRAVLFTHATTAGKFNMYMNQTSAGTSVAMGVKAGSFMRVYQMTSTGSVLSFGSWS